MWIIEVLLNDWRSATWPPVAWNERWLSLQVHRHVPYYIDKHSWRLRWMELERCWECGRRVTSVSDFTALMINDVSVMKSSTCTIVCLKIYWHGEWRLRVLPRSRLLGGQQCRTSRLWLDVQYRGSFIFWTFPRYLSFACVFHITAATSFSWKW